MSANLLAQVFLHSEIVPLTARRDNELIAKYQDMVLLITPHVSDVKAVNVFRFTGFQTGETLQDSAVMKLINRCYQQGMVSYLRKVVQAGNAEYLEEPAKSYLLRHGTSIFSEPLSNT